MALVWCQRGEEGGTEMNLEFSCDGREARLCFTVFSLSCDLVFVSGLASVVRKRVSLLQRP